MNILKRHKYLIFIILLGTFLRLISLLYNPPSLYGDELTLVYDSYSLLKTGGYDSTGQFLPVTFSMGAGRPAGYVYLSIPFVALFGPTALGVRMLSMISGVGLIILVFLISKKIFNEKVGLITALLSAISIWDIGLSRAGFEAHLALFLVTLAIYLLLGLSKNYWRWGLSAICFSLVMHTYPTYKLSLPILLGLLAFYHRKFITSHLKQALIFLGVISIFIFISALQLLFNQSEIRFNTINIFAKNDLKQQIITKVNNDRNLSILPDGLKSLFYNQPLEYSSKLLNSYLDNFSLSYLLISGDGNPRHNPSGMGVVYFVEIITLIFGLLVLLSSKFSLKILLLGWLLIAPIPTTLLLESHSLRNSFMLPPILMISALGITYLLENQKNKANKYLLALVAVGFIWQFIFFFQNLLFLDPATHSSFWSTSAKEAVTLVNMEKQNYDYVLLSDRLDNSEFAYQVYTPVDPNIEIKQFKNKYDLYGLKVKKIDNVYIGGFKSVETAELMKKLPGRVLYIAPNENQNSFSVTKK